MPRQRLSTYTPHIRLKGVEMVPAGLQRSEQETAFAHTSYLHGAQNFNIGGDFNIVQGNQIQYKFNAELTKLAISRILLCPSPSPFFVGREDVLLQLSEIFAVQGESLPRNAMQRVVVLVGNGGRGKTQVAVKFVADNCSR